MLYNMPSLSSILLFLLPVLSCSFVLDNRQAIVRQSARSLASTADTQIDPKEKVKLFGRLAEKYIMLDETAGMCCYSACKDCEYRLPDGGYRMADQSAARPKWIPVYVSRTIAGKDHKTKWSTEVWQDDDILDQATFVERVLALDYLPTLGGPYLAASAAVIEDKTAVAMLFQVMSQGEAGLSIEDAQRRWSELAKGQQGINWAAFSAIFDQLL